MSLCLKYLANYYFGKGDIMRARQYAERCTEFEPSQEDGKKLLTQINDSMNKEGVENMRRLRVDEGLITEDVSDTEMVMEEQDAETDESDNGDNEEDDEMELSNSAGQDSPGGPASHQEQNEPDEPVE
uniref:TPR_REGION domain-containing protein n=1 Tax=Steinernema glaseri TaxID=37863 RepID=A0A1I7YGW1_9BILA